MPTTTEREPSAFPPINQEAIVVHPDDFQAMVDNMGDGALNQRFTLSKNAPRHFGEGVSNEEAVDSVANTELQARPPIEVTPDLLTVFTFGGPDNPAIKEWLDKNGVTQGEDVDVLVPDKEGNLVVKRVSTQPSTFFVPVEKLVSIDSDDFDHAEIVPTKKFPIGASVIVARNIYDSEGNTTGEKTPDTGWKVIGYGEKNGQPTTKVRKFEGDKVFDKEPTNDELDAMQRMYSPENQRPVIAEAIVRKTGHQELESAGIIEPVEVASEVPKAPEVDPYDALPDDVKKDVDAYRAAQKDKRDAERDKDYAGAADAGRFIYSTGLRISPAAQEFVGFRK